MREAHVTSGGSGKSISQFEIHSVRFKGCISSVTLGELLDCPIGCGFFPQLTTHNPQFCSHASFWNTRLRADLPP